MLNKTNKKIFDFFKIICSADGEGSVWEREERAASPIPAEQKTHNQDDEEKTEEESHHTSPEKHSRDEEDSADSGQTEAIQQSSLSSALDTPVCAKNISLTPTGERVILWTR